MEIRSSVPKHGVTGADIQHAIDHALVAADEDDGKVLYLGPDHVGNLLEIVSVLRDDETEIVIHAMGMRRIYGSMLHEIGSDDD